MNRFTSSFKTDQQVLVGVGYSSVTCACAHINAKLVNAKSSRCNSISVTLTNGTINHSEHIVLLPNTRLPRPERLVHLFVCLNKILLSLGHFCDAGIIIILTKHNPLVVMDEEFKEFMLHYS